MTQFPQYESPFQVGERVMLSSEAGQEFGIVTGWTRLANAPKISLRMDDGTTYSAPAKWVHKVASTRRRPVRCVDCGQLFDRDDDTARCPASDGTAYHRSASTAKEG